MTTTQTQEMTIALQDGDRIYLGHASDKALVVVVADGKVTMTHGDTVTAELDLATLPKDVEAALLRGKAANAESKSKNCSLYAGRI